MTLKEKINKVNELAKEHNMGLYIHHMIHFENTKRMLGLDDDDLDFTEYNTNGDYFIIKPVGLKVVTFYMRSSEDVKKLINYVDSILDSYN